VQFPLDRPAVGIRCQDESLLLVCHRCRELTVIAPTESSAYHPAKREGSLLRSRLPPP
jgi:hypothetical protein